MNTNRSNDPDGTAAIGCVMMIVAIFLIPLIIELLKVLMVVAVIGGLGFLFYKIFLYDQRTGNVTYTIEKTLNLPISDPARQELPEAKETMFLDTVNLEKQKEAMELQELRSEINNLKNNRQKDISDAISMYADRIEVKKKKEAIESIFTDSSEEEYRGTDVFEQQQHQEKIKEQEKDLNFRNLQLEVAEELFEQKKALVEFQYSTKEEFINFRQEVNEKFLKVEEKLQLLAQGLITLEKYFLEKFTALQMALTKELESVKGLILQLETQFKQETSDIRLQFGQEILRIDKQQMTIIDKMRDYGNQLRAFENVMMKIKLDAERFSMRGQEMLAKANIAQQQHKAQIQVLSKEISTSLERMSLKEMSFANAVGSAKNRMDEISNRQYLALKDMAFERIGINALREDYQKRVSLEQEKLNRLNDQHRSILQQIQMAKAHGRETAQLQHRLSMTQEDLNHSQNQLGLYRQEMAQVRRLSN